MYVCMYVYGKKKKKIRERPVCRLAWQPCDKEGFCLLRSGVVVLVPSEKRQKTYDRFGLNILLLYYLRAFTNTGHVELFGITFLHICNDEFARLK